jgi:succinate-acetate transporter protein
LLPFQPFLLILVFLLAFAAIVIGHLIAGRTGVVVAVIAVIVALAVLMVRSESKR